MDNWLQSFVSGFGWEELVRLLIAAISGAILGWERERAEKPAGLRTHMMVALGAALFMITTLAYVDSTTDGPESLRVDPTRVIAGVIGGVGFLGAGTIIEARGAVHGITTAASIWVVAAMGTASGLGMYGLVIMTVLIGISILWAVGWVESIVERRVHARHGSDHGD